MPVVTDSKQCGRRGRRWWALLLALALFPLVGGVSFLTWLHHQGDVLIGDSFVRGGVARIRRTRPGPSVGAEFFAGRYSGFRLRLGSRIYHFKTWPRATYMNHQKRGGPP